MAKNNHTPGPWKVFPIENKAHHHTYYKVGNSTTDDVRHATSVCNVTTRNSEQAEANAKLIARAPQMLEDVKKMYNKKENEKLALKCIELCTGLPYGSKLSLKYVTRAYKLL